MRKRLGLALAIALLAVAAPLSATTIVLLSEDDLVDQAARIVHGDVVSRRSFVAAEGGRIYTEYVFRPREMLKGATDGDGTVVFREWGGEVDGLRYAIPGVGSFAAGDEVLAFLGEPDARTGVGFTTGLSLGKFRVIREAGRPAVARRSAEGLRLVDRGTGAEVPAPADGDYDLEAFKAKVRARLRK